jgi:hypothetical protein
MNYSEKLVVKTQRKQLEGEFALIEANGYEATVTSASGTVYIAGTTANTEEEMFPVLEGERISLCGSFYIYSQNADVRILYCKIL